MSRSNWGGLTPLRYGAILADPAWQFQTWSAKGAKKSAQAHYDCMPTAEIAALPVGHLAAPDSVLFLWATFPMLLDAIEVMNAWGFKYKTGLTWAKQSKAGRVWNMGPGYWFRTSSEILLVGTRGKPKPQARNQKNLIVAPIREHSRKPDEIYDVVENVAEGPYCELFSRSDRVGWDAWGNESSKFGIVA